MTWRPSNPQDGTALHYPDEKMDNALSEAVIWLRHVRSYLIMECKYA
jgi:hypothetical protein